ncbi:hypothetical protein ACFL5G_05755 [Candidatus Margulisiibacteriota bacterium]
MKKIIIAFLVVLSLASVSSASIIVQTQANLTGTGVGLGLSMPVVPMLLDLGVEVNSASSPWSYSDKGSYTDPNTSQVVNYDGTLSWKGTRYGIFAKFNLAFITPIIRAGAQEATISLDGSVRLLNEGGAITEEEKMYGSYISIGFPFYIGPVFIEPSIGTQSIYVPHYLNVKSFADFQLAIGMSFL